ncbi:hypothetical protein C0J52_10816 [Blattella germanica]|nr:hypothetical protein C0J52_10816 [Blattella germanica]PSN56648.1 hypothetical protein C0J52_10816 [Blattella germanica]
MNICQDKTKYTLIQNSFHYNSVKLYNSVPQAYRYLSIIMFKNKIKNILQSNALYSVDDFYSLFKYCMTMLYIFLMYLQSIYLLHRIQ